MDRREEHYKTLSYSWPIGMIIYNWQKENGVNNKQLADRCGCDIRTVIRAKNGGSVSLRTLEHILNVCDYNISADKK